MGIWMKSLVVAVAFGCISACSPSGAEAQNGTPVVEKTAVKSNWTLDKTASSISFSSVMSGDVFTGNFGSFTADIQFDPENLSDAEIYVAVDMASADANDEERNEALPGKEWFFAKEFPKAVFNSKNIIKTGEDQYEAVGELTIKDVTNPLTLPFSLKIENGLANANGKVSINRSDFGVGTGMWKNEDWVVHKVDVIIKITASSK